MIVRKLTLLLMILICGAGMHLHGQGGKENSGMSFMDNVGYGGNLGLRVGSPTYIEVSPIAGYRIGPFLMPGIGVSYRYIRYQMVGFPTAPINLYGASAWVRAYVAPMIFGYAEYEVLNGEWDPFYQPGVRSNIFTSFVGGGYSQEMGGASTYVMVLYPLNNEAYTPYMFPVIRVGFMIGGTAE